MCEASELFVFLSSRIYGHTTCIFKKLTWLIYFDTFYVVLLTAGITFACTTCTKLVLMRNCCIFYVIPFVCTPFYFYDFVNLDMYHQTIKQPVSIHT